MFRPITLKQINSLTSINTFSCLDGREVTHPPGMGEVPGLIPALARIFMFALLFC